MDNQSPTWKEASSYIMSVKLYLDSQPQIFKQFVQTLLNLIRGRISPKFAAANVCFWFKNEPELLLGFQKFLPISLQQPKKSKVVFNKLVSKQNTDFKNCLQYVTRVQQGLENHPDSLLKFFELMEKFEQDLDEEKLKEGLFALFKLHPEYEIEFLQFATEEPYPAPRETGDGDGKVRVIEIDPLQAIMNEYEDIMFHNDMLISAITSAIENTVRLLGECRKNPKRIDVTTYLTCKNLEDIKQYCNVDLQRGRNIQERAYAVVGKLRQKLEEIKKENGAPIRIKRERELERFRRNSTTKD